MMATAFMGYVLPWGQMSFWGATVITGFFTAFPGIGEPIQQLLLGGFAVDNPTLNRFFSLHYLLPFMIAGVVILHVWALHVTARRTRPASRSRPRPTPSRSRPMRRVKDALGDGRVLPGVRLFHLLHAELSRPCGQLHPANPLSTPSHIVPEWYFLPFYAILRAITFNIGPIDSKLGGVLAMFGSIIVLFFLPWLDTSKVRSAVYRPWYKLFFWLFIAQRRLARLARLATGGRHLHDGCRSSRTLSTTSLFFLVIMPVLGLDRDSEARSKLDYGSGS
jgi:ubiquinol-cytochrome c reductase cytochrome b subunit